MAKENSAVITNIDGIATCLAEIFKTAKIGYATEARSLFHTRMALSPMVNASNDGANIAHWTKVDKVLVLMAKVNKQSVKNLAISANSLSGTKTELHKTQQAILRFFVREGLLGNPNQIVTATREQYHKMVNRLETKKEKTPPPKAQAQAQAQEAQGTAQEKQEAM